MVSGHPYKFVASLPHWSSASPPRRVDAHVSRIVRDEHATLRARMAGTKADFTVTSVPAPGRMAVDWEERVDFRRLNEYRLGRARQAIANAGLGGVLVFDMNNSRYITSTTIGEWARDKVARFALLTRTGDPILWDFGSAAKAHRLHAPWLRPENSRAGMTGLRGSVAPEARLSDGVAKTVERAEAGAGRPRRAARCRHRRDPDGVRLAELRHQGGRCPAGDARRPPDQVEG